MPIQNLLESLQREDVMNEEVTPNSVEYLLWDHTQME